MFLDTNIDEMYLILQPYIESYLITTDEDIYINKEKYTLQKSPTRELFRLWQDRQNEGGNRKWQII